MRDCGADKSPRFGESLAARTGRSIDGRLLSRQDKFLAVLAAALRSASMPSSAR